MYRILVFIIIIISVFSGRLKTTPLTGRLKVMTNTQQLPMHCQDQIRKDNWLVCLMIAICLANAGSLSFSPSETVCLRNVGHSNGDNKATEFVILFQGNDNWQKLNDMTCKLLTLWFTMYVSTEHINALMQTVASWKYFSASLSMVNAVIKCSHKHYFTDQPGFLWHKPGYKVFWQQIHDCLEISSFGRWEKCRPC